MRNLHMRFFKTKFFDPNNLLKTTQTNRKLSFAILFTISLFTLSSTAQAQAPQVWGSASPSTVEANTETTTLSWGSSGATSCESGGSAFSTSGSLTSGPFAEGTHSVSFSCTGPGGTSYETVTWTAVAPPPVPTLNTFTLSPNPVLTTQSIYLSWSSTNATSCSAAGGTYGPSGTVTYPPGTLSAGSHSFSMQCSGPGGSSNTLYASITVNTPPPVPSVPTGLSSSDSNPLTSESYTVSWNAVSGATSYNLYENGSASNLGSLSRSYTKTSANTFVYEVSACNSTGCSSLSAGITVTVSAPPPTPISLIGFDAEYKGYWPTSSSTNDLYIVRQSSDNNYEGVSDFILEEQLDGSYSLNANPTSGQIAAFNLTTPASIGYELFDVNLDGAIDMILMDSTDTATGFVYAATSSQSAPIGYKHIDSEFIEFFEDIYPGIEDPNYYKRTAKENNWGT